ncbi:MAG: tRNA (cytidine(56)-2'-O)-methyltransferase [Candidatus Diapherotrites archaeon CG10_big_fil_rev_8_21_14_0_10_31_34]|nr:MAG: tRNA (cytidine(56)-2'-O)-methyltransferase [Candidatus Diapherotrites archaeon CG10_big_fil_rev_8_21_14_0_10_31_34]
MVKDVCVLRLGHRIYRDIRTTTHCALTARAFGAKKIIVVGEEDNSIKKTIQNVVENWGGKFEIDFSSDLKKEIKKRKKEKYTLVHLTMYGERIGEKIKEIRKIKKVCIIIGAEKVPPIVYKESDYNISVGNQPHSEVAALAVTLNELFEGKALNKKFNKAQIKIIPQKKGKKTKKTRLV